MYQEQSVTASIGTQYDGYEYGGVLEVPVLHRGVRLMVYFPSSVTNESFLNFLDGSFFYCFHSLLS